MHRGIDVFSCKMRILSYKIRDWILTVLELLALDQHLINHGFAPMLPGPGRSGQAFNHLLSHRVLGPGPQQLAAGAATGVFRPTNRRGSATSRPAILDQIAQIYRQHDDGPAVGLLHGQPGPGGQWEAGAGSLCGNGVTAVGGGQIRWTGPRRRH
jgi:hypothetical protein